MIKRKFSPTQLALFSRSPVVGAWWEELKSQGLFKEQRPDDTELDKQLFIDGLRHEEVLIKKLKKQGFEIAKSLKRCGFDTTLITGPTNLDKIDDINTVKVETADEMFKKRGSTIHLTMGNPIDPTNFNKTKSNQEWAQAVKNHVYNLENNPNFEFGEKDN